MKLYKGDGGLIDLSTTQSSESLWNTKTNLPKAKWTLKVFIEDDGRVGSSSPSWAATDYIPADNYVGFEPLQITDVNGVAMQTRIAIYDISKNFLGLYTEAVAFDSTVSYFRICFGRYYSTGVMIKKQDITDYFEINTIDISSIGQRNATKDKPRTWGQRNVIERAKQMSQIVFTTTNTLSGNGLPSAGNSQTGLPYSHALVHDKIIGINVSFHTFMTAVHNPKSILYTVALDDIEGWAADTYYGVVCSTFTAYALGKDGWLRCSCILHSDDYETVPIETIELGDMTVTSGHTRMITGIWRDEYQRITRVETTSAELVGVVVAEFTWKNFLSTFGGTTIRRYKYKDTTPYTAEKYIPLMDEAEQEIVYSDICTNMGDKATIKVGESITLNPLVTDGYTEIHLYKDGEQVGTYAVEDTALSDLSAGEYAAKLYPYADNAETSFIVCDCTVSLSENRLSFNGYTGGTPKYIEFISNINDISSEKVITLSTADITNGYVDMSDGATSYSVFKLFLANDYGEVAYTVTR